MQGQIEFEFFRHERARGGQDWVRITSDWSDDRVILDIGYSQPHRFASMETEMAWVFVRMEELQRR
jgi:hypothetical protein